MAKKKVSKKTVRKQGVVKTGQTSAAVMRSQLKVAHKVAIPTPQEGDIVMAYSKHFIVGHVNASRKLIAATHCSHVEMHIDTPLSRDIPFMDIVAVYRLTKASGAEPKAEKPKADTPKAADTPKKVTNKKVTKKTASKKKGG